MYKKNLRSIHNLNFGQLLWNWSLLSCSWWGHLKRENLLYTFKSLVDCRPGCWLLTILIMPGGFPSTLENAFSERYPSYWTQRIASRQFVVQKWRHVFSLIALYQNHEQENKIIKGDGGAAGLTDNPAALKRWMVAGSEVTSSIKEFELAFQTPQAGDTRHHEQTPSTQRAFAKDVIIIFNPSHRINGKSRLHKRRPQPFGIRH